MRNWAFAGLLFLVFAFVALPIGLGSGLFTLRAPFPPLERIAAFAAITFFVPSLLEELVFRVLLVPHPEESAGQGTRLALAAIALSIFVLMHPVNAWLLRPEARPVFCDPVFLLLAGLMGCACTAAYWRSGSIWPPVAIHWLSVLSWKVILGGPATVLGP